MFTKFIFCQIFTQLLYNREIKDEVINIGFYLYCKVDCTKRKFEILKLVAVTSVRDMVIGISGGDAILYLPLSYLDTEQRARNPSFITTQKWPPFCRDHVSSPSCFYRILSFQYLFLADYIAACIYFLFLWNLASEIKKSGFRV